MSNSHFAVIVSCGFQPEEGYFCRSQEGHGQDAVIIPFHLTSCAGGGRTGPVGWCFGRVLVSCGEYAHVNDLSVLYTLLLISGNTIPNPHYRGLLWVRVMTLICWMLQGPGALYLNRWSAFANLPSIPCAASVALDV